MKVYHGTNAEVATRALTEGLKPRIATGRSNWRHTIESNPSLVYLTTAYAPYFAIQAVRTEDIGNELEIGLVEIETDLLDQRWLLPDEDFVEQATRDPDTSKILGIRGSGIKARTRHVRQRINDFASSWKLSLDELGNCAHRGVIPAHAITAVSLCRIGQRPQLALTAQDAQISLINYKLMGEKYRLLTKWCMGERVSAEELTRASRIPFEMLPPGYLEKLDDTLANNDEICTVVRGQGGL